MKFDVIVVKIILKIPKFPKIQLREMKQPLVKEFYSLPLNDMHQLKTEAGQHMEDIKYHSLSGTDNHPKKK